MYEAKMSCEKCGRRFYAIGKTLVSILDRLEEQHTQSDCNFFKGTIQAESIPDSMVKLRVHREYEDDFLDELGVKLE